MRDRQASARDRAESEEAEERRRPPETTDDA
jgi:hypothetical protein